MAKLIQRHYDLLGKLQDTITRTIKMLVSLPQKFFSWEFLLRKSPDKIFKRDKWNKPYTYRGIHHRVSSTNEELEATQMYTGGMVWQITVQLFHY